MAAENIYSTITLNDGVIMPIFGFGTYTLVPGAETEKAVLSALEQGYRLVDTAQLYKNEESVGIAIKQSGIPREDIFIVSKVQIDNHGYQKCLESTRDSLKKLDVSYIDQFLIHTPKGGKVIETYDALLQLQREGLIRSVGVSNFNVHHLEKLLESGRPAPSVNQIELHPFLPQQSVVDCCKKHNIGVFGYAPLARLRQEHPALSELAEKYNKTVAQILIRWSIQKEYICIPKSARPERIAENSNVFDFSLRDQDMEKLVGFPEYRSSSRDINTPWYD